MTESPSCFQNVYPKRVTRVCLRLIQAGSNMWIWIKQETTKHLPIFMMNIQIALSTLSAFIIHNIYNLVYAWYYLIIYIYTSRIFIDIKYKWISHIYICIIHQVYWIIHDMVHQLTKKLVPHRSAEFDRSGMGLGAALVGEPPPTGPGICCGTWAADAGAPYVCWLLKPMNYRYIT